MRTWANAKSRCAIGLIHPDSHLTGSKEGRLRAATYPRLRTHAYFVNEACLFEDLGNTVDYGLQVYGSPGEISFAHLSRVFQPETITESLRHDGNGDLPGIKFNGAWDIRPHAERIVRVDRELLAVWGRLVGSFDEPVEEAKILYPVTTAELDAIAKLAEVSRRFGDLSPDISSGFHESADKKAGYFEDIDKSAEIESKSAAKVAGAWSDVILQGPHFAISTAFSKAPRTPLKSNKDWDSIDLTSIPVNSIPLTNYRRSTSLDDYRGKQDRWVDFETLKEMKSDPVQRRRIELKLRSESNDANKEIAEELIDARLTDESKRPYTDFWRLTWRMMIPHNSERSLYPAVIPPGPAHVNAVHSASCRDLRTTVLHTGFYSSLILDYYLRAAGINHLQSGNARSLPSISPTHPFSSALILRTLRLNCLTDAYASLWAELYDNESFDVEDWAFPWPSLAPLRRPGPRWEYGTPLRTDYERRAALIEIDALTAVILGITAEQLRALYTARFAVLSGREEQTWFDAEGSKLCGDTMSAGYKQAHTEGPDGSRDARLPFQQLSAYLAGDREEGPAGFPRFPESSGLAYYRANRLGMEPDSEYPHGVNGNAEADTIGEYAYAHKVFSERLAKLTGER
jgi:hypothetical protein